MPSDAMKWEFCWRCILLLQYNDNCLFDSHCTSFCGKFCILFITHFRTNNCLISFDGSLLYRRTMISKLLTHGIGPCEELCSVLMSALCNIQTRYALDGVDQCYRQT